MSQQIVDALHVKLVASQIAGTLYDSVGGRIYEGLAPDNETQPMLVYTVVSNTVDRGFGLRRTQNTRVQFDLYSAKTGGAAVLGAIEQLLYDLLEGVSITPTDHDRGVVTFITRGVRMVEEDAHRIMDEILIQATDFT